MAHSPARYYVPHGTKWPIIGTIGLFTLFLGASNWLNGGGSGSAWVAGTGVAIVIVMIFLWFGQVIKESESGEYYNADVDASFRMGMGWFIFSEVMFFAVFFGALWYMRNLALPWLGGEGNSFFTPQLIWPGFEDQWPSNGPANVGGAYEAMPAWGLPAINTVILLSSGVTLTIAHHALIANNRKILTVFLAFTFILGFLFIGLQAEEYIHAYTELNLKLTTGVYGTTFFMLTGFHGLHVTIGATMLLIIWIRCLKGHFTPDNHFAFEGIAWYWHFVDIVWLGLFIFVYWL
ncbi:MAG: cytochrome c oxidase subunit 3 [Gammaproteobacteria bacterium]|nr:MAG: cytochrome c oxidase subunit 3 [Gammaproteobacteria bacterium]